MATMPRPRLTAWALAVVVLGLGAFAEALAPSSSHPFTIADFAVGAEFAIGAALLLPRAPRLALLSVAVAVTWFLGTLAGAGPGPLSDTGSLLLLAYRGALLQLLLSTPSGFLGRWQARFVAGAGWAAALLPVVAARPATALAALAVAVAIAHRAGRSLRSHREPVWAWVGSAMALSAVWGLAMTTAVGDTALLTLDDLAVAGAGIASLLLPRLWARPTAVLVVELGSSAHAGQPVAARLARVLSDPGLEIHYNVPGVGWVDEKGHASAPSDADARVVTRASAPVGGEVALVHGPGTTPDARLAEAAAAAVALVFDTARLEANLRRRAEEVRASRRRLLSTADAERRTLEGRLSVEVLSKLRSVGAVLGPQGKPEDFFSELRDAIAEVAALGRGLYPPALASRDFGGALKEMSDRCPVPAVLELHGDINATSEPTRAAAWFVCAEALANVARHSGASNVAVSAATGSTFFVIQVTDNGRGGAWMSGGLRGLADRVEALGGEFTLSSPDGGPTVVRAALPA